MKPRVLITREPERAHSVQRALEMANIEALVVPVTRAVSCIEHLELPQLFTLDWIVFTSLNAANAFHEVLQLHKQSLPDAMRIACVGKTTAARVKALFGLVDFVPQQANAAGLAAEFAEAHNANGLRLLWPCAKNASAEMPAVLRGHGAEVLSLPCYDTAAIPSEVLRPELLSVWPWRIALFAAPSAVKSFAASWPQHPWAFCAVAIGPATYRALQAQPCAHIFESSKPETTDVVAAIQLALVQSFQFADDVLARPEINP